MQLLIQNYKTWFTELNLGVFHAIQSRKCLGLFYHSWDLLRRQKAWL